MDSQIFWIPEFGNNSFKSNGVIYFLDDYGVIVEENQVTKNNENYPKGPRFGRSNNEKYFSLIREMNYLNIYNAHDIMYGNFDPTG